MDPWEWIGDELRRLDSKHLLRQLEARSSPQTPARIELGGRRLYNFSSNDYLGLAADPRLARAAAEAAESGGWGSGASPLITGRGPHHMALEQALARFEGVEAVLLFPSGYAANVGAICSLVSRGDVVLSDAKNHASIIDGCRLSRAEVRVYPHNDVDAAAGLLSEPRSGRALIVTDSLFSMDGDLAPLAELADLAERQGAMMLVDEAHATGVLGSRGRGGCELAGVEDRVLRVGTLSKAAGSIGGFVAGPPAVIEYLTNRARTQFYSTAMPGPAAAASCEALRIIHEEPWRRQQLLANAARVRRMLRGQGWQVPEGISQIVPIVLGDPRLALWVAERMRINGVLAPAIRPPSVPPGESLIRISLSAAHDTQPLAALLKATAEAWVAM